MQQHVNKAFHQTLPWSEPLSFLPSLPLAPDSCWILLYSSMRTTFSGRYSFLALRPEKHIKSSNFTALEQQLSTLSNNKPHPLLDGWFGYLGYGLKNSLEDTATDIPSLHFPLPPLWMVQYRLVLVFDHETEKLEAWATTAEDLAALPAPAPYTPEHEVAIETLGSNMTGEAYLAKVQQVKDAINAGALYQANVTRKFYGSLTPGFSPIHLFRDLCAISPAPYSALIKLEEHYILSSSPEQFLSLTAEGKATTRPIKGSARRYADSSEDAASKAFLAQSEKNHAENLMIVDLMRNDLSRTCETGSVKVENLFEITSYATIHHLSSTITGQKRGTKGTLALIKACFPPGSMTGAPKISAMELCSALEKDERGVYSGCLGWIGGDGAAELSVVIRTLLLKENRFEFQVGGGIVADSDPEEERQETLSKARAIAKILGISLDALAGL